MATSKSVTSMLGLSLQSYGRTEQEVDGWGPRLLHALHTLLWSFMMKELCCKAKDLIYCSVDLRFYEELRVDRLLYIIEDEVLHQVEEFKYPGVLFMNEVEMGAGAR